MKGKFLIVLLTAFTLHPSAQGQQAVPTNEQLGSSYFAYPSRLVQKTIPKGLTPVYLSHYGRHGSRWLTEDARYEKVLREFDTHELTPLGYEVRQRLERVWQDARGRSGDLTRVGERQHHDIAQRMVRNFPTLFCRDSHISAQSSTSRRCMMSMMAACESIKELVPSLNIQRSAHERDMDTINHESQELLDFKKSELWRHTEDSIYRVYTHHERLMRSLFLHPEEITDPRSLFDGLYWIASDMQNVTLPGLSFYDLFTRQELEDYWKAVNYRMYVTNGPSSLNNGIMAASSRNLLLAIVRDADRALASKAPSVNLRFGHDSALLRLLTLMGITTRVSAPDDNKKKREGDLSLPSYDHDPNIVAAHWQDFRLVPMAANLQIVFFCNEEGAILVHFLLNEEPAHLPIPFTSYDCYDWEAVKSFWGMK